MTYSFSDLQKWVSDWESPNREFRQDVHKDCGKTICAFANTVGGLLVFGVSPKKETIGLKESDESSRRLREQIDLCRPRPMLNQEFVKHEGKIYIVVAVEPFSLSQNPCFYDRKCYIRQGTTDEEIFGDALIDFLRRRTVLNFEELKSQAKLPDLDENKLSDYFSIRKQPFDAKNKEEIKARLVAMKCAAFNGEFYLKHVAPMFFASEPQKFFNNLEARIVVYKGKEKELEQIGFDERLAGTVPELIDEAFAKVHEKIGKSFTISGTRREEVPDYPLAALREAITNAIGHRDYFDPMVCFFEIYSDRLELTNPGGLLPGQNASNFDKNPLHRNPLVYRLLQDYRIGEGLGSGVEKIRKQCRMAGLPDPEFHNLGTAFRVVFYNRSSDKPRHLLEQLNQRQKQVMAFLEKNKAIKALQYAKLVGVSQPTASKDLSELIKQGKIRRIGKFRGAYYELAKQ